MSNSQGVAVYVYLGNAFPPVGAVATNSIVMVDGLPDFTTMSRTEYWQWWWAHRHTLPTDGVLFVDAIATKDAREAASSLHLTSRSRLAKLSQQWTKPQSILIHYYKPSLGNVFPGFQFPDNSSLMNPFVTLTNRIVLNELGDEPATLWWHLPGPRGDVPIDVLRTGTRRKQAQIVRQATWLNPYFDPHSGVFIGIKTSNMKVSKKDFSAPRDLYNQLAAPRKWHSPPGQTLGPGFLRAAILIAECVNIWVIHRSAQLDRTGNTSPQDRAFEQLATILDCSPRGARRIVGGERWITFYEQCLLIEHRIVPIAVLDVALTSTDDDSTP